MNRQNGPSGNYSDAEPSGGYSHENERSSRASSARRTRNASIPQPAPEGPVDERAARPTLGIDAWSLLRPAARRWYWLIFGAIIGGVAGVVLGVSMWKTFFTAEAQIIHVEPPMATDAYVPPKLNGPTLVGMIQSPEIMKNIAAKLAAQGKTVGGNVSATPERMSEIVTIRASGADPRSAIELANMYNAEVIAFTREYQRKEAEEADVHVNAELATTERKLAEALRAVPSNAEAFVNEKQASGAPAPLSNARLARMNEQLEEAQDKLSQLLLKYHDIHPDVRRQREIIADLKARLTLGMENTPAAKQGAGSVADTPALARPPSAGSKIDWELASYNVMRLNNYQAQMEARKRQIQVFRASPPGNFKVLQAATVDTVYRNTPWLKIGLLSLLCATIGTVLAAGELLRREVMDTRLKTEADVSRVTGLPVIAHLGDIRQMSLATRETWAFRAWIALQDHLASSPNHGLICGITSSNAGDGRSTWINLLASAARKCGFRVLTIATKDAPEGVRAAAAGAAAQPVAEATTETVAEPEPIPVAVGPDGEPMESEEPVVARARASATAAAIKSAARNGHASPSTALAPQPEPGRAFGGDADLNALATSAFFTPAMVSEKLMSNDAAPVVHIPLPGWTWSLDHRKQWQSAINVWRRIDNVVILVELPPASMPETVLLASNLPNLIWLVEANKSEAAETRAQLETLRHARCNIVGAVINKAMKPVAGGRLSRWISCLTLFAALGFTCNQALAADTPADPNAAGAPTGIASFSVVSPQQRAAWQKKLTLGPGDVLTLSLYGEPELTREEIAIGPDGRISYLEASDVVAAGLTVDEFRDKLNDELSKYRRTPQAFVLPVAYKSKKYFVLGRVQQRGPFPLDRPTTLLEAVARAGGLETGLASDRSLVELADLKRAFISRNGERLKVDFEKLFLQGDLTQNVALEPDDYIYFPGGGEREVYVLGAVRSPGSHTYHVNVGAVSAIAARGGFSDRAWTKRVLVVRGGLGAPETFRVDAADVLSGRTPDVVLQPKDIVYVSDRPWIYAEELLDAATNAFVTSAVVIYTTDKVTRDPR